MDLQFSRAGIAGPCNQTIPGSKVGLKWSRFIHAPSTYYCFMEEGNITLSLKLSLQKCLQISFPTCKRVTKRVRKHENPIIVKLLGTKERVNLKSSQEKTWTHMNYLQRHNYLAYSCPFNSYNENQKIVKCYL